MYFSYINNIYYNNSNINMFNTKKKSHLKKNKSHRKHKGGNQETDPAFVKAYRDIINLNFEKDSGYKLFGEGGEFNNLINILLNYIDSDDDNISDLIDIPDLDNIIATINNFLTLRDIHITLNKGVTTNDFKNNLKTFFNNSIIKILIKSNSRDILKDEEDNIKTIFKLIIDNYYDNLINKDNSEIQFINNLLSGEFPNIQKLYPGLSAD